jgi:hypothetical protein
MAFHIRRLGENRAVDRVRVLFPVIRLLVPIVLIVSIIPIVPVAPVFVRPAQLLCGQIAQPDPHSGTQLFAAASLDPDISDECQLARSIPEASESAWTHTERRLKPSVETSYWSRASHPERLRTPPALPDPRCRSYHPSYRPRQVCILLCKLAVGRSACSCIRQTA